MTNATLEYPDWYIRNYNFRIGYHVVIDRELWRVVNRNPIFPHEKNPGSTWLLPANTEIAKESISDYYEAGKNTLYTLLFGFYADRLTQIKIFKPGATQMGGTKNETNVPITNKVSPLDEPRVLLFLFGNDKRIPEFQPKNLSSYQLKYIRIGGFGHKYRLEKEGEWGESGQFTPIKAKFKFPSVWTRIPTVVMSEVSA